MPEAAGIFVSRAHEDNTWCRTFVEALRQAGADVWYDEDNLGYEVLGEEIERELQARPTFILIRSQASSSTHWMQQEIQTAAQLRRQNPERITLPVVATGAEATLFRENSTRVRGPWESGLGPTEAARIVLHTLGIVSARAPAGTQLPLEAETAAGTDTLGNGLEAQKRFEEILTAYEEMLATYNKGLAALDEERAAYERALALDPQNAMGWNDKGMTLRNLRRGNLKWCEEALSAFEHALTLDPQNAAICNSRGNVLFSMRQYEGALSAYEQALTLDPRNILTWINKGVMLNNLRRYPEALAAFEEVLTLDPQDTAAWSRKINLLNQLGRSAEVQEAEKQRKLVLHQG